MCPAFTRSLSSELVEEGRRLHALVRQSGHGAEIGHDVLIGQERPVIDAQDDVVLAEGRLPHPHATVVVEVERLMRPRRRQGALAMAPQLPFRRAHRLGPLAVVRDGVAVLAAQVADDRHLVEERAHRLCQGLDRGGFEEEGEVFGTGQHRLPRERAQRLGEGLGVAQAKAAGEDLDRIAIAEEAVDVGQAMGDERADATGAQRVEIDLGPGLDGGRPGLVRADVQDEPSHVFRPSKSSSQTL